MHSIYTQAGTFSIVTKILSHHIDLHTYIVCAFDNRVTLTFDLLTSGSLLYMCIPVLAVDSSSGFSFRARIHTKTDTQILVH